MKNEWIKQMIVQDEQNVSKLIDSMPEDAFDQIYVKGDYSLLSHEHTVRAVYDAPFECKKLKGFGKCLSGLDDEGKV